MQGSIMSSNKHIREPNNHWIESKGPWLVYSDGVRSHQDDEITMIDRMTVYWGNLLCKRLFYNVLHWCGYFYGYWVTRPRIGLTVKFINTFTQPYGEYKDVPWMYNNLDVSFLVISSNLYKINISLKYIWYYYYSLAFHNIMHIIKVNKD